MPHHNGQSQNPLVAKLSGFAPLSRDDVGVLEALCSKEERVNAGVNLVDEGTAPRRGFVLTHGLVCRYRLFADGQRQILTLLIPGDFYDLHGFLLSVADHSVVTMVAARAHCDARPAECGCPRSLFFVRIAMAAPRDRIERRSFAPATADPGRHRRYAGADGGAREPGFAEAATRWAHHAGSPPPYAAPRRSVAEPRAIEPRLS